MMQESYAKDFNVKVEEALWPERCDKQALVQIKTSIVSKEFGVLSAEPTGQRYSDLLPQLVAVQNYGLSTVATDHPFS